MNEVSYEVVIGLEVHAQLLTQSKLFSGDPTAFGAEANTQVSAITLGHPGTLPRLNREAVKLAVKLGLATNCSITRENFFARKNYFYPDLPKGYQISQHTTPICRNGHLDLLVNGVEKHIRINRIHIEEDAGKSGHEAGGGFTQVDFNRAGMPLVEIVTEPDLRSADEAFAYVTELRRLVRQLRVCDGNMEQGSLRCDVNISVRPMGETTLGTKVEIKNLNSIRFIRKAIEHETTRLIALHRQGKPILQQTRGLDEKDFTTFAIRTKEDEDDYRYFPEPDLPPFLVTEELIESLRAQLPPTPAEVKTRLQTYGLTDYDAGQVAADPVLTDYFTRLAGETPHHKAAANWTIGPVRNWLQAHTDQEFPVPPAQLAGLIGLVDEGKISFGVASQQVLPQLINEPQTELHTYILANDLYLQGDSDETDQWIEASLRKFESKIPDYKKGKKGLISLFVGEVMKLSKGKADARLVTEKITEKLK